MNDQEWFVSNPETGDQLGPLPGPTLLENLKSGAIRPDYFLWCDGMSGWQKAELFVWLLADPPLADAPEEPEASEAPAAPEATD